MRTTAFDFSPLFRTGVGFEHMSRLLDAASRVDDSALSYPPYNIEQLGEDRYRITMAVAGFSEDDIDIVVQDGKLSVKSKPRDAKDEEGRTFLHRGIAQRAFERQFQLAEHVEVIGAALNNGLLEIDLERVVPEEKKPRTIKVGGAKQISGKKAA
jgi:molecular chaperone IbpA